MQHISSPQNQKFKEALRLKTSRGRKLQQRLIIFGERETQRALESEVQLAHVFCCLELLTTDDSRQALQDWQQQRVCPILEIPKSLMETLSFGDRLDGIVAVAERPKKSLQDLQLPDDPLIVVLQGLEKPGNIGAVLRTADGCGVDAVIVVDACSDPYHPNAIRSSMASVFTTALVVCDSQSLLAWCADKKIQIMATSDSGTQAYSDVQMTGSVALAFGNEAQGLTKDWLSSKQITNIAIPMFGVSDSLNVSVAAGVVLYEARRQRTDS